MSIIVHGPQGCGKSKNAQAIATHFGCVSIVEEWDGRFPLPQNTLVLTNAAPASLTGPQVLSFDGAFRLSGVKAL